MTWIKTIAIEVFGLFVDDLSYAVAILVWVSIAAVILPHLDVSSQVDGPIFFLGVLVLLVAGATLKARG